MQWVVDRSRLIITPGRLISEVFSRNQVIAGWQQPFLCDVAIETHDSTLRNLGWRRYYDSVKGRLPIKIDINHYGVNENRAVLFYKKKGGFLTGKPFEAITRTVGAGSIVRRKWEDNLLLFSQASLTGMQWMEYWKFRYPCLLFKNVLHVPWSYVRTMHRLKVQNPDQFRYIEEMVSEKIHNRKIMPLIIMDWWVRRALNRDTFIDKRGFIQELGEACIMGQPECDFSPFVPFSLMFGDPLP